MSESFFFALEGSICGEGRCGDVWGGVGRCGTREKIKILKKNCLFLNFFWKFW